MLIVSGRGQVVVLDEPERHLAGECWRDDWAVRVVSAVCPSLSACFSLDSLCGGGWTRGVGLRMAWVAAWLRADCVGGAGRDLDSTSLSGTLPESVGEMSGLSTL